MASDISSQFIDDARIFAIEPIMTKKLMQSAALLVQNSFKAFKAKKNDENDTKTYLVPSSKCAADNAKESYYKELL